MARTTKTKTLIKRRGKEMVIYKDDIRIEKPNRYISDLDYTVYSDLVSWDNTVYVLIFIFLWLFFNSFFDSDYHFYFIFLL